MLFFGHIGITASAARIGDIIISKAGSGGSHLFPGLHRVKSRIGQVDYRLVLLGALLPDLIDKPVFLLVGGGSLSGRDYAHGLLFNLLLLVVGLVLTGYGKPRTLMVSLSSLVHLIFDRIWINPVTLFWPLLGPLSGGEVTAWLPELVFGLFNSPAAYVPEIIGLIVVFFFVFRLVRRKGITGFVREGVIV